MSQASAAASTRTAVERAIARTPANRRQARLDQLFSVWFARFVYNQIWEDPAVDMAALALGPGDRVVAISSGGCNILNYLVADPASIDAVDLNPAHLALTRLKIAAMRHLPDHAALFGFFGIARSQQNIDLYWRLLAPELDYETRRFWERRHITGRRLRYFRSGLYRKSLLGQFVGVLHGAMRATGRRPSAILAARSLEEQRALHARHVDSLFDTRLVGGVCGLFMRQPLTFYHLGIPPAQYEQLRRDGNGDVVGLLRERVRRLACDFPIEENYFAWQAFGRRYDTQRRKAVPPYLRAENFASIRSRIDRVHTHRMTVTEHLRQRAPASVERFVLLDAVDWMDRDTLTALWQEIRRTAAPGARVIFRTAGSASCFAELLEPDLLQGWEYRAEESRRFQQQDRAAIYGGFHLYVRTA